LVGPEFKFQNCRTRVSITWPLRQYIKTWALGGNEEEAFGNKGGKIVIYDN